MPTRRLRPPARPRPGKADPLETGEVQTLTDLEQVRLLADPTRLRIMEVLCLSERTTKQVAEALGEKPTKLYHHVEALERVGLIRLARTRQNRGTIEKYYRAVARAFRVDSRMFSGQSSREMTREETRSLTATLIERTASEFRDLVARATEATRDFESKGVLTYLEIRASDAAMARIGARLTRLASSLATPARAVRRSKGTNTRRFRLTIAFFPLDRE